MTPYAMAARGLLLSLLTVSASWAAPGADGAGRIDKTDTTESLWHCRSAHLVLRMHWREVSAAEGCDGESCRLTPEPMTEGVILSAQGQRIGIVALRGDARSGWTFRDVEGRAWRLRQRGGMLTGAVWFGGRKHAATCELGR